MKTVSIPSFLAFHSPSVVACLFGVAGFLSASSRSAADPAGLDLSFGTGGTVVRSCASGSDAAQAMILQPDGKIVVAGYASNGTNDDILAARFLTNGAPDSAFGTNGAVITPVGSGADRAQAVLIQADGKIVVAGSSHNGTSYDFAVLRYLADGTPDTGFDGDGKVTTSFGSGDDMAQAVAIQPDGKIVVAGHAKVGSTRDIALARYNTNGSPDTTFDTDGKVTFGTTSTDDYAMSVAVTGTVRIVTGGFTHDVSSGVERFAIVRFTSSGALDTTFNTTGYAAPVIGLSQDRCHAIVLQPDNKIVAAGFSAGGSRDSIAVVRFESRGALDTGFGAGGIVTTELGSGDAQANAVFLQGDGKIVVAGDASGTNGDIGVVRYLANGDPDTGFSGAGMAVVPAGDWNDSGNAVAVQADGKIVAAGSAYNGSAYDTALVRLLGAPVPEIAVEFMGVELTHGAGSNFIAKPLNGTPASMTFTIRNAGSAVLENLALSVDGTNPGDFTATPLAVSSLAPGATTLFTVSFLPLAEGARSAAVHVASNDSNENPFDMPLSGTGLPPLVPITSSPLPQAMVGAPYDMSLSATGGSPPYTWAVNMGSQLPPGLALATDGHITGSPSAAGAYHFNLVLTDSGGNTIFAGYSLTVIPAIVANQLDGSFGTAGKTITPIGTANESANAMVALPDGNLLVAGYARVGATDDFALARYLPDGTLDTSFGTNGIVTTAVGNGGDIGRALAVQGDGMILVTGDVSNGSGWDAGLARYWVNGQPDPAFGTGGKVTIGIGNGNDFPKAVLVQSSGKIVVVGEASTDIGLVRFNTDGTLDTSFGTNGKVVTNTGSYDYPLTAVLQGDDKILVGGRGTGTGASGTDILLARYQANGALDTTFGSGGILTTAVGAGGAVDHCQALAVQGDGKIIAAGHTTAGNSDFAAVRYLSNGVPDTTFGTNGVAIVSVVGYSDKAMAVALQSTGGVILAGYADSGTNDDFAMVRLHSNGTVDNTFGSSGRVTLPVGSGHDHANAVALQADGRVVLAGEAHNGSNYDFALVRYIGALAPEIRVTSSGVGGLVDAGAALDFGYAVVGGAPVIRSVLITNAGTALLSNLSVTRDGANAADFTTTQLAATSLAPGASTWFNVGFSPAAQGARTAALHIVSNDSNENPFDIAITGSSATPIQAWRQMHYGSVENAGMAADAYDLDGDGLPNLLEYAFTGSPSVPTPGFLPLMPPLPGGQRALSFRCDTTRADLTYTVQASSTLAPDSWTNIARSTGGATAVPINGLATVSDSGVGLRVVTVTPAASVFPSGRGFLRVSVSY